MVYYSTIKSEKQLTRIIKSINNVFSSVQSADTANHIETDIARATLSCLPNAKIEIKTKKEKKNEYSVVKNERKRGINTQMPKLY